MILVLLGSQKNSFNRLLNKIEECIKENIIDDKIIAQIGHTHFSSKLMETFDSLPKEKLEELIDSADLIITHGGVGSILQCIKKGKKVISVARLKEFDEHVNDHQIQIVDSFGSEQYIVGITDVNKLPEVLNGITEFSPKPFISTANNMMKILCDYIDNN